MPLQEELNVIVVKESALSPDAQWLIKELSEELSTRYGDGDSSSFKPEDTDKPKSCFVIARIESNAVGCGALMPFEDDIAEVFSGLRDAHLSDDLAEEKTHLLIM